MNILCDGGGRGGGGGGGRRTDVNTTSFYRCVPFEKASNFSCYVFVILSFYFYAADIKHILFHSITINTGRHSMRTCKGSER